MSDLLAVEAFVGKMQQPYGKLVEVIKDACEEMKQRPDTGSYIHQYYSRGQKQDSELKDASKILEKVEPPVTDAKLRDVGDIAGVTIVAHYPDHITHLIETLLTLLGPHNILLHGEIDRKDEGYFATHVTLRGASGAYVGLKCEVQFKTVLHDAWSAKMHDLTYKPQGAMDQRMSHLMTSIGFVLEGLEKQSAIIRKMIAGRHALESRAFRANCDVMFALLNAPGRTESLGEKTDDIRELRARVDDLWSRRANTQQSEVDAVAANIEQINRPEWGWLLMTRLACGGALGDRSRETAHHVDRFLQSAHDGQKLKHPSRLIQNVPMALYVAGDFSRAVDYSERLMKPPFLAELTPDDIASIEYNRDCFLLEREHLRPSRKPAARAALAERLRPRIFDDRYFEDEEYRSAALDSRGLFQIVFGACQKEVRLGIDDCVEAARTAPEHERELADACREWRLEAGWRRYFDLVEDE